MASKKRLAAFLVALVVPLMVSANFEVGYSGDRPIEVVCRIMPVSTGLDNDSIRIPIVLSNNMANDSIA
ncbi:MAG: hypothetical protein KAT58_07330, partial [candidate division Zixibacteria bacterium]|nr:hypothetical protein [candidate division Zixibacteria bacterium]